MTTHAPRPPFHLPPLLKSLLRYSAGLLFLVLGIAIGFFLRGDSSPATGAGDSKLLAQDSAAPQIWTCSMHPQVQQPKPGLCPLCGMELIPLEKGQDVGSRRTFTTSDAAKALMKIETAEVVHRFVTKKIRMVGKLDFDETRLGYITAWVPGRIDRLFVDYTGVQVQKGDHLVDLYSPELILAQEELKQASRAIADMRPTAPDVLKRTAETTRQATRDKLRRWGLTDQQITDAESSGVTSDHITIYAPMSGTVIDRVGQEGMYVNEGTRVYTIADLSTLWLQLDAYESDLTWLHYGQTLTFTTEAYPGETFSGKISFIDPVLNKDTRTVKVRVVVANPHGRLKPEMFVRAVVEAQVATDGRVMDSALAGKWISPMHPEIIKDKPGNCDVCGMALVKAENLGYVPASVTEKDMPLVIPATAPLVTGTRAVVYVEKPGTETPAYEGRTITLGPRAGDYYIVAEGLTAGEHVVTRGNFKIDSALQIQAKTSMMSGDDPEDHSSHDHAMPSTANRAPVTVPPAFLQQWSAVITAYTALSDALAADQATATAQALPRLEMALDAVQTEDLNEDARIAWVEIDSMLRTQMASMKEKSDIHDQRHGFAALTLPMTHALQRFPLPEAMALWRFHCPMADDNAGADWLQIDEEKRNPYMGASMLSCGILEEAYPPPATMTIPAECSDSKMQGSSTKADSDV